MQKFDSVDEYINAQPEIGRTMLTELRDIIHKTLPNVIEKMSYGAPTFLMKENAILEDKIMIGGFKNHVSFYPFAETINVFRDRLSEYKVLEGTIRFKHNQKIPTDLIKEMLLYKYQ